MATATKPRASDHGDPAQMKFPIMSQAHVMSAARLVGRGKNADGTPYSDEQKAAVKKRIKRIANRKGFALPKAWQSDAPAKAKKGEALALSAEEIRQAFQQALDDSPDPDGDGDDDRADGAEPWERPYCYVSATFPDETPMRGIYSFDGDDDCEDDGLYQRSFTVDPNGAVVLGDDVKRVVRVVNYVDYVAGAEDGMESLTLSEGTTFTESAALHSYEALAGEKKKGRITGTAIQPGINRSKNRYYPLETLAKAVPLFAGKKMYIDHPTFMDQKNGGRSFKDMGAIVENAWLNGSGGIDYTAVVVNPQLDEMLALMDERGVLGHAGVSVHYSVLDGNVETVQMEGMALEKIGEWADLSSLDFVNEAGAWGDVAHMESHAAGLPIASESEREAEMADEAMVKNLEARLEAMQAEVAASRQEAADERKARRISETKTAIKDALSASELPKAMQGAILAAFAGAESVEGLEGAIAGQRELLEALKDELGAPKAAVAGEVARKPANRVIVGMGGKTRGTEGADAAPDFAAATDWLFEGADGAKRFSEAWIG